MPLNLTNSLFSQIVDAAITNSKDAIIHESVRMTKREKQVIDLIANGSTNKEMAQKLHLSVFTIKSHVHNILEKLALHSRIQIAKYSFQYELSKTIIEATSVFDD